MRRGLRNRVGVILGAALAIGVAGVYARGGAPAEATYLGSKMCMHCHRGLNAEMVKGWENSPHARAMWKAEAADDAHKIAADFTKNAPFPKEKVVYVLGSGRQEQAYLDADLKVLPGVWNVKAQTWRPQEAVDAKKDCLGCHTSGYDPQTGKWTELGVGCEMCHGPGSVHAGGKDKKATITNPKDLDSAHQAMGCGRCHAVGKSKDGPLTFPATFHPGDDLEASFVVAQTVPPGARNGQYNELRFGGGKHFAAGTGCTTCHDPQGAQPDQLRAASVNELCLKCHGGKLQGPQHGEAALKAASCNVCHMRNGSHTFVPSHHKS